MDTSTLYKNSFEKFLSHTDEKSVLAGALIKLIKKHNIQSVLDIGAGNGDLSIPLSKEVQIYKAIEKNPLFVESLQSHGIDVMGGKFPISLDETYDMVLISHVLPYIGYEDFLQHARKYVKRGGVLLIVSFRSQEDDRTRLLKNIDVKKDTLYEDYSRIGYNNIITVLNNWGNIKYEKVQTHLTTQSTDDMIECLSFVWGNGIEEDINQFLQKRTKIEKILKDYYIDDRYVFPFNHYFLEAFNTK